MASAGHRRGASRATRRPSSRGRSRARARRRSGRRRAPGRRSWPRRSTPGRRGSRADRRSAAPRPQGATCWVYASTTRRDPRRGMGKIFSSARPPRCHSSSAGSRQRPGTQTTSSTGRGAPGAACWMTPRQMPEARLASTNSPSTSLPSTSSARRSRRASGGRGKRHTPSSSWSVVLTNVSSTSVRAIDADDAGGDVVAREAHRALDLVLAARACGRAARRGRPAARRRRPARRSPRRRRRAARGPPSR